MQEIKTDINNRNDLEKILAVFYTKVFDDKLISHFFTEVVPLNLESHLPVITDFWEAIIFNTGNYRKNVMEVHQSIHKKSGITREHLDRWLQLFSQTIDEYFEGDKAALMKQRAVSIATLMDIKLNYDSLKKI